MERFRKSLEGNEAKLVKELDVDSSGLWTELQSRKVLTERHLDECKSERSKSKQIEKLLEVLKKRDDYHYEGFCEALDATGQTGVLQRYFQEYRASAPSPMTTGDEIAAASAAASAGVKRSLDLEHSSSTSTHSGRDESKKMKQCFDDDGDHDEKRWAESLRRHIKIMQQRLFAKDFVNLDEYHQAMTDEIFNSSLDPTCNMYKKNEEEFEERIHDRTLNQSSKNFLRASRFLCNFKSSYRHKLDKVNFADQTNLHTEVLGLAASILQTAMNGKRLSKNEKKRLQQVFLGEALMPCLQRHEDGRLDGDFIYRFPEVFLRKNVLKQKDWFRLANDEHMAEFCTADIDEGILDFVIKCFVNLYDTRLRMTSWMGVSCEKAVRKLEQNGFTRR